MSHATACLLAALAVWRVTHLLQMEDGPAQWLARAREWIAAAGDRSAIARGLTNMLACFYCLSLWVALPVAAGLATGWAEFGLLWPGLSGAAILLERLGGAADRLGQAALPAPAFWEEAAPARPTSLDPPPAATTSPSPSLPKSP